MDDQTSSPRASALDPKLDGVDADADADADVDVDADAEADDTESVISDLSTDETAKDFKTDFWDAMSHVKMIKPFLSLHTLSNSASGVSVVGIGNITMPLEEAQAQRILSHAEDNLGVDEDEDVCFLTLFPDEFTLDEAIWPDVIQGFLDQAARDLGVTTPFIAEPEAMVLLKCGQTYSEQELVSFEAMGNLIIFLPSRHEGGEIVVKHGETEKVVFAPNQAAQSFTTWGSKIKSLPIQSGYLWALHYTVEIDTDLELRPLCHTLRRWIAKDCDSRGHDLLYYPLQGDYTNTWISHERLKDEDLYQVVHLQDLSDKIPFEIFLARRDGASRIDESPDQEKYEACISSMDGHRIANCSIYIDSQDSGVPSAAVVIIPRDTIVNLFQIFDSADGVESLFINYARACLEKYPLSSAICVFKQICSFMMAPSSKNAKDHWDRLTMEGKELLDILEAFLVVGSPSWFTQVALKYPAELPQSIFRRLGKWLTIEDESDKEILKAIEEVLSAVVLAYHRPAQQIKAVKAIINLEQERSQNGRPRPRLNGIPGYILPFVRQVLKACIESCETKQLTAHDGQALAGFSLYFDDPFAILSLTKDRIGLERQPAAILGLIHKINYYCKSGYLLKEEALKFSRDMARSFITSTAFVHWRGVTDGYYFKADREDDDMDNFDNDYDEADDFDYYGDLDGHDSIDYFERQYRDEWNKYQEHMKQTELEDDIYDEYDEYEFNYADSYRTFLYLDEDTRLKRHKNRIGKNRTDKSQSQKDRYEHQYGKAQSSTFFPPGVEEKGVHYRSFFCFFEQIFAPVEQPDEVLELLVTKVVEVAPQIPDTEFDTLWIPLAKEFIPLVRCLGGLIGRSREALMSRFISAILEAYVNTWVGPYPERPGLERPGVRCSCADCKGLNVFLANRLLRAGRFKADRTRVQHILDEMARARVDFKSEAVEDADSSTLVVTKTERLLKQARRQWGNRRYHASQQVAKFGLTGLEFVFGTEWTSFLSMAHLGGIGFDNLEIRTLLGLKTGLSKDIIKARSATMFFRGLLSKSSNPHEEWLEEITSGIPWAGPEDYDGFDQPY
ncbi:hypothetical protein V8C42DRAFT_325688 [Trichoderma barbatum]